MRKNKFAFKRLRNVIFLGLILIIMLGIYNNTIRNSKAENRIQVTAIMQDPQSLIGNKEVVVDAVKNTDGTYDLQLTNLIDGKKVTKYWVTGGTEISAIAGTALNVKETDIVDGKVNVNLEYDRKVHTSADSTIAIYNQTLSANTVSVNGYVPEKATLKVQELDISTFSNITLPEANLSIKKAFDITIEDSGALYQPNVYGETVNVSIAYEASSTPTIYHISDDNVLTKMASEYVGRSIRFDADHFSKYLIATSEENEIPEENTNTITNTIFENTIGNTVDNTIGNLVANEVTNEVVENPVDINELPVWTKESSTITESGLDIVITGTDSVNWGYDELKDDKIEVWIDGEKVESISETVLQKEIEEKFAEIKETLFTEIDNKVDADATIPAEEKEAAKVAQKAELENSKKEEIKSDLIKNKVLVKLQNREDILNEQEVITGVKYTVSLTNMVQTGRQLKPETIGTDDEEYKRYLEWSGNVSVKIAQGTLTDVLGNTSLETVIEETEKIDKQTNDKMFVDTVKPEINYQFTMTTEGTNKKTLTVIFDVVDKYFGDKSLTDEDLSIAVTEIENANELLNTSLTKIEDIKETINGVSKKVGERYELIIDNVQKLKVNDEQYYGAVQIIFKEGAIKDTSENLNIAKTLTILLENPKVEQTEVVSTEATTLNELKWKIFYNDGTYVYLILDGYLPHNLISESTVTNLDLKKSFKHSINWDRNLQIANTIDFTSSFFTMRNETASFTNSFNSSNVNYKAAAGLLKTNEWKNFVNTTYAIDAIGSPTLEMWVSSWNALYPGNKLYCSMGGQNGYGLGTSVTSGGSSINLKNYSGYNNTLFYPYQTGLEYEESIGFTTNGYWIASPAASNAGYMYGADFAGVLGANDCGFYGNALRPVVRLKSYIEATKVNGKWVFDDEGIVLARNITKDNYGEYIEYSPIQGVVDTEKPVWKKVDSTLDKENKTATITIQGTDKNYEGCSLNPNYIDVFVDGKINANITKSATTKNIENGIEYVITLGNLDNISGKIEIEIPSAALVDERGNTSESFKVAIGIPDWKIFYNDGENVFLIATDYLKNTKIPDTTISNLDMTRSNKYNVYWNDPLTNLNVTMDISSKYFTMKDATSTFTNTFSNEWENYRVAASLLKTSEWTSLVDNKYAIEAVGSPTVEMWMSSWNALYPASQLYCNNGYAVGYYVGTTTIPTTYYINLKTYDGYSNSLYYPHQSRIDNCNGYWLASPSSDYCAIVLGVYQDGEMGSNLYYNMDLI